MIEAEYIALNEAENEAIWIKKFSEKVDLVSIIKDPIEIFCDKEGEVILAKKSKITQAHKKHTQKIPLCTQYHQRMGHYHQQSRFI